MTFFNSSDQTAGDNFATVRIFLSLMLPIAIIHAPVIDIPVREDDSRQDIHPYDVLN